VTFEVSEGDIVGLIGPNGAGKTTLIDAISGFAPATGTVSLDGVALERLKPHQRIRAGLGRTFQAIELWEDLTVEENVVVGLAAAASRPHLPIHHGVSGDGASGDGAGGHRPVGRDGMAEVFGLLGLGEVADRPAGELSQGQRQLVSIARALVGRPKVLLLDEPAGGLDSTESQWLGERLRAIRDSGVTILLIDHDMHLVLNLCDQIQVLNFGKIIAAGPPAAIRADRTVAQAYLGDTHATPTTAGTA
jgi:ABC-type branched-subunit amino acid transport system ATPase component